MKQTFPILAFAFVIVSYFSCNGDDYLLTASLSKTSENEKITLPNGMNVVKNDSFYVFQGDIFFTEEDIIGMSRTSRGGYATDKTKWEPTIPYVISSGFLYGAKLSTALEHWTEATNIKFVPRTTQSKYIQFNNSSEDCSYSDGLGKPGRLKQHRNIYIDDNATVGTIIHEIGHALGLTHEHCRADRDNYIRVITDNIVSDKRDQYDIYDNTFCSQYTVPFDFNSIMMYSSYNASAIDPHLPVMEDINDPTHTVFGGCRNNLSPEDRALFNRYLYRNEQYYISGNEIVQVPSQSTFTVRAPENSQILWSITPSNSVSIISGQNTNAVTLQFNRVLGNIEYTLHANIITPHGYTWDKYFNITASAAPVIQDILMYKYCQGDGEYTLEAKVSDVNVTMTWNTDGTLYDILYPDDALFLETPQLFKAVDFYSVGTHIIEATATSAMGSNTYSKSFTINDSKSHMMSLAPNPSSTGTFTVDIKSLSDSRANYIPYGNSQLNIYSQNKIIYTCKMESLKKRVELPDLKDGQYIVEYVDANNQKMHQVLVVKRVFKS